MSFEIPVSISNHTSKRMEKFNWGGGYAIPNSIRALACHEKKYLPGRRVCEKSELPVKSLEGKIFPVKSGGSRRSPRVDRRVDYKLFNHFVEHVNAPFIFDLIRYLRPTFYLHEISHRDDISYPQSFFHETIKSVICLIYALPLINIVLCIKCINTSIYSIK